MCVLNVFNFTNNKLHLLPLNCFCFMSQAPSFSCPRKTIQSLPMSRKRCSFFMCVLNVFYCKIAFVATKLPVSFMYVVGSLDTVVILNCVVSCSWLPLTSCPRRVSLCRNIAFIAIKGRAQIDHAFSAGTNGYPIPDPNPKYFSIPDPYPINFQNHRVFRVSGIREKPGFWHEPISALVWILAILSSF